MGSKITEFSGKVILPDGTEIEAKDFQTPVSNDEGDLIWGWKYGMEVSGKVILPDGTAVYSV
jgi:hypothetical protein